MNLKADNVCKIIKKKEILKNINLDLYSGKVYGFVGRNGSGKTMLFRALSGLIRIDSGSICSDGLVLHKDMDVLPNMGIVLENAGLYSELTGLQNLELLAKIKGNVEQKEIINTIQRVGLEPEDKRSFRKYSLGMKQRIIIAQAIMEKPDIIFLDEPTNALDEQGIRDVRKIIDEERNRGALILLASHNREDIDFLSDEVFFMKQGKLFKGDDIDEI